MTFFGSQRFLLQRHLLKTFLITLSALLASGPSFAGQLDLAWDASTSSDVGGYRIYYGQTSGTYTASVDAGNVTSYTVPNLAEGKTYYFAAKAYNSARTTESAFSNQISATIPSVGAPVASFTANRTSGVAPLTVTFNDTSTGNISRRSWNLGNGSTSTGVTASTSYASAGTYTVRLTVEGAAGTDTATRSITVTAPTTAAPVADFSATTTTGIAPMTVNFSDKSTGATAWSWRFGDGDTSSAQNPSHRYATAGTYNVTLTVTGPGGTHTTTKNGYITLSSGSNVQTGTSSAGLVAAYGFDDITGTRVPDNSGNGNDGTLSGATPVDTGRFGQALSFNGWNNWVSVDDSASLDLSGKMTLEAWVYPKVWMTKGATVLVKEDGSGNSAYYLYANEDTDQPLAGARIGGYRTVAGVSRLPANRWAHLATTYDGQYLRLYVDGQLVDIQPQTGPIPVSGGKLRLGGNAVWGEYLNGYLDDVRVYNRALTRAQIVADAKSPVVSIVYSTAADRTNAKPLNEAPVTGKVYVFTTPDSGSNVSRVEFWVDESNPTNPSGAPDRSDSAAPFDLAGGSATTANPSTFAIGTHTVTIRYTLTDGTVLPFVTSRFTVR